MSSNESRPADDKPTSSPVESQDTAPFLPLKSTTAESLADSLIGILSPARASDEIGRIGTYRILAVIGSGAMGIVLRAEDSILLRTVAVKILNPMLAVNATYRARFLREARAVASITHKNIISIYYVGEQEGVPYIVMPILRGQTLEASLSTGKLSLSEVVRIGQEVAEGLGVAHRQGLIHRDIKPANLWLEAETGEVKILDFGIAHAHAQDARLTDAGMVVGTPAYMAPEQAGGEPVSAQSDLFSLGCVLYRLCTDRLPFAGDNVLAVLSSLATASPRPPSEIDREVPETLSRLVMQMLARSPSERPASAEDVATTLRLLGTAPVVPVPGQSPHELSAVEFAGAKRRTHRLRGLFVVGIVAVGVAGVLAVRGGSGPKRDQPVVPPADEKNMTDAGWVPSLRTRSQVQFLVPAYFYPAGPGLSHWDELIETARSVGVVAIINPRSGPGIEADPNYTRIVARGKAAGLWSIGYISTQYAKRPLAQVIKDLDNWFRLYPEIQGIFVDEQATGAENVDYYVAIARHARKVMPATLIVTNPGMACARDYLARSATDVICMVDQKFASDGPLGSRLPGWVAGEPQYRVAALVSEINGPERMRQLVLDAGQKVGFLYFTDARLPNPWDRLPTWWEDEVMAVRDVNRRLAQ